MTRTVPIVFMGAIDPVGAGLVASLARPGGNATGFSLYEFGLSGKWLELLKELTPRAAIGHEAAAAPPRSVMNSRRFIGSPRGRPGGAERGGAIGASERIAQIDEVGGCCAAGFQCWL
jgi:hypothetical protein